MAKERVPHLPNVPSSLELGIKDIHQITFWNGLHVARGTPEPIVRRIQELSADVLTIPALRERMEVLRSRPSAIRRRVSRRACAMITNSMETSLKRRTYGWSSNARHSVLRPQALVGPAFTERIKWLNINVLPL